MFCKHDWKLIDKTILESGFEQIMKEQFIIDRLSKYKLGPDMFVKTVSIILKCEKCGKLDKTVTSTENR